MRRARSPRQPSRIVEIDSYQLRKWTRRLRWLFKYGIVVKTCLQRHPASVDEDLHDEVAGVAEASVLRGVAMTNEPNAL